MYKNARLLRVFLVIAWVNFNIFFIVLVMSLPVQETYDIAKATPIPTRISVTAADFSTTNPFLATATPFFAPRDQPQ